MSFTVHVNPLANGRQRTANSGAWAIGCGESPVFCTLAWHDPDSVAVGCWLCAFGQAVETCVHARMGFATLPSGVAASFDA